MSSKHHFKSVLDELWIPGIALLFFFALQSYGHMSELWLTFFMIGVASLVFYWQNRVGERYLFISGVLIGCFVELGLRILGYQQAWTDATLFGIPFWLPISWGMGFVLITRLGIILRGLRVSD